MQNLRTELRNAQLKLTRLKTSKQQRRRYRIRRRPRRGVRGYPRGMTMLSGNQLRLRRSEVWMTITTDAQAGKTYGFKAWKQYNYPPWLKSMCALYEKIAFRKITVRVVTSAAATTEGTYVLSYNASAKDALNIESEDQFTQEKLMSQEKARTYTIRSNGQLLIPKSTLNIPYRQNLGPGTVDDDTAWLFDFMYRTDASAGSLTVFVDYDAVLYTPQARL